MPRALVLAVALVALTSSGCDEDEPAAAEASGGSIATIRAGLAAVFAGDHADAEDTATGECFAEAFTDLTTPEQLRDAGVLDASYAVVTDLPPLTPALADAWVEAQFGCVDFVEQSTRAQVKITKGRIDAEEYAACLRRELTEDDMRAATSSSLTGDWDAPALSTLADAQGTCSRSATPPDPE